MLMVTAGLASVVGELEGGSWSQGVPNFRVPGASTDQALRGSG